MAHIIKVMEFQSRYQSDLQRYPSQFTRLKKERWHYLQDSWKRDFAEGMRLEYEDLNNRKPMVNIWNKAVNQIKGWTSQEHRESEKQREEAEFQKLKDQYKQEIYEMQLLWAGAVTDEHKEQIDMLDLKQDKWLQFLALELPDNCFVFYKPIIYVKKAEIELEVLLITPSTLYCISLLKGDPLSIIEANSERYWVEYIHQERRKRLSPIASLERMERVVRNVLEECQLDLPVKSLVITPDAMIDDRTSGLKFECIDNRTFDTWKAKLFQSTTPLKYQQVKAAECLLTYCDPQPTAESI